ncbi:hypothetical protein EDC01DRAFT_687422 [Geopyxis carbonaria]|nr:hypothetical protein EDC01DRAFT_687422 [Geopyxis carbonaria]
MSHPRLSFLYPLLLKSQPRVFNNVQAIAPRKLRGSRCRYRHGSAVEPILPSPPPPPPPLPSSGPATQSDPKQPTKTNSINDGPTKEPIIFAMDPPPGLESSEPVTTTQSEPRSNELPEAPEIHENGSTPSPYQHSHHFDTYHFVRYLETNGEFKRAQSEVLMKGIRGLLTQNMQMARKNLVSRSYIENESYLFQAACSELRNEMQNTKKLQVDQLRTERTRIQMEYDLLNQRFLAEIMSLKDELNGMFNDRKMVTRAEQRAMENKIQELNYKITILINSDLKSEIEKLRWTTTRRGLIAILALALVIVASIRINGNEKEVKKKKKKEQSINHQEQMHHDHGAEHVPMLETAESAANFVSLG